MKGIVHAIKGAGRRAAFAAFARGVEADETTTFANGTRAGCRDGWAVERAGDQLELVEYGPAGWGRFGPYGEARRVEDVKAAERK